MLGNFIVFGLKSIFGTNKHVTGFLRRCTFIIIIIIIIIHIIINLFASNIKLLITQ